VLWILAAYTDNTLSFAIAAEKGEAVFADAFDGCAYFHAGVVGVGEVGAGGVALGAGAIVPSRRTWSDRKR
jgi:hypothetical protein